MRGPSRESELVETPPHRAEFWFPSMPCCPLPASGARNVVRRDRKWNDDGARKQLLQFFEAWGGADEATVEGRKRLSTILFS